MTKTRVPPFVDYMGGKSYAAKWIVSNMPPHRIYVEVFGGGASVLFAKPRAEIEIYNDRWDDIVNLFRVLRDKTKEFQRRLGLTLDSRSEFERFKEKLARREFLDDVDRAVTVFYLLNRSINALMRDSPATKAYSEAIKLTRKIEGLPVWAERFRSVTIENLDFREIIPKYDASDTLFYCDPPYLKVGDKYERRRPEEYYRVGFTYRDWFELAKLLNNIQGKAMVSTYYFAELEDLFPRDRWVWLEKEFAKHSTADKGKKKKATELLLLNYKPPKSKLQVKAKSLREVFG